MDVHGNRRALREKRAASWLTGWRHFAFIGLLGLSATSLTAYMLHDVAWWEWLALPLGFLIANLVEWAAHRWPMHNPLTPRIMYEKHTLEHHHVFTETTMEVESPEDFDMVLFSFPSLVFFLLGLGLPIALLFFFFVSWNTGWLFAALAVDYYVLYECFHLAYHLPQDGVVGRLPGMALLRRHHTHHHVLELMHDWNFNVTFPVCDVVFGTSYRAAP